MAWAVPPRYRQGRARNGILEKKARREDLAGKLEAAHDALV